MSQEYLKNLNLSPDDEFNQKLANQVHPQEWKNPQPQSRYNLVVLGAGTGGLIVAAGAAGLGAKVALVEKHLMGGDCLNVGCVPSKSIIKSARVAAEVRNAKEYGVEVPEGVRIDFAKVMQRMREIRSRISKNDSAKRFSELGVDVFIGEAKFLDDETVGVGDDKLKFKKAVIATGARATGPPIPGLSEAGYLTNETLFNLTECPKSIAVIGGGPIGCEMAQTLQRLGSQVIVFDIAPQILIREDKDAAEIVQGQFEKEGIGLELNSKLQRIEQKGAQKRIVFSKGEGEKDIVVDEILVGAGRAPNVQGLNLDKVGVQYDEKQGVQVDDFMRTTNQRIFACGDICSPYKFTHTAEATAKIVIQNALFFGKKKASELIIPWCTYTSPEIAHVGMYEEDAQKQGIEIATFTQPLDDVDRAIADGEEEGFVKIHVKKGTDKIVGATIVAQHAGELITEITTAIMGGMGLSSITNVIHPYPTQADAIKKAAYAFNRTKLTPVVKNVFAKLMEWQRNS